MQTMKIAPVDHELIEILVQKRQKNRDTVTRMLGYNMVPISWFCYLAGVSKAQISRLTDPTDPKLDEGYPFNGIDNQGKMMNFTGPKFILLNEKSINYIKKRRYDYRRTISETQTV